TAPVVCKIHPLAPSQVLLVIKELAILNIVLHRPSPCRRSSTRPSHRNTNRTTISHLIQPSSQLGNTSMLLLDILVEPIRRGLHITRPIIFTISIFFTCLFLCLFFHHLFPSSSATSIV